MRLGIRATSARGDAGPGAGPWGWLRRIFSSLGLRTRLTIVIALPMFVLVVSTISIDAWYQIRRTQRSMIGNVESIIATLSQDFERLTLLDDQAAAADLVDRIAAFGWIDRIFAYDANGRVIFAYRGAGAAPADPPTVQPAMAEFSREYLHVFTPIRSPAGEIGTAFVQCSTARLHAQVRRAILTATLTGAGTLMVGLALAYFLQGAVSRPIIEIQRAEQKFRELLESSPEAMVIADGDGVIQFVNRMAEELFGYARAEMCGQPVEILIPEQFRQRHVVSRREYIKNPATRPMAGGLELRALRSDGSEFPAEISLSPLHSNEGLLISTAVRNLTDRKRLEAQLAQAQKLESIGQLAAGIAHEINTPTQFVADNTRFLKDAFRDLQGVLGQYEQLVEACRSDRATPELIDRVENALRERDLEFLREEVPKAIDQTLEGVERVATIVRSMKEFAHPGAEEKTAIDLNRAIASTLTVARSEWKYVADVVTDFDQSLPPVSCVPGEINQVVLNLIINAAHAIADVQHRDTAKGTISLSTRQAGDSVEIRVGDTGTGVPPEIRHKLFDPFFTTKPVGEGTGQGLAIARTVIVEKHGGSIRFESEVGQGTTFIIRIPIAGAALETAATAT